MRALFTYARYKLVCGLLLAACCLPALIYSRPRSLACSDINFTRFFGFLLLIQLPLLSGRYGFGMTLAGLAVLRAFLTRWCAVESIARAYKNHTRRVDLGGPTTSRPGVPFHSHRLFRQPRTRRPKRCSQAQKNINTNDKENKTTRVVPACSRMT